MADCSIKFEFINAVTSVCTLYLEDWQFVFANDSPSFCFAVDVQEEGMSGIQFFFTIVFSILGLGVLAVVGLMIYTRWKKNRRKRFY